MNRRIEDCQEGLTLLDVQTSIDPIAWLIEQAADSDYWLLAHADDGVIWGLLLQGILTTGRDAAANTKHADKVNGITPPLRTITLQTARLFNGEREIYLWRDADTGGWRARVIGPIADGEQCVFAEAIDERYLLWGSHAQPITETFTLMEDGSQGLRHVLPVAATKRPRLVVRQLISEDETGFKRISASRLVAIEA